MNIGLLGGSFDPVHSGHIYLANEVVRQTDIEAVWFIPAGKHPFKHEKMELPFQDRYALLQKVIRKYPYFKALPIDAQEDSPSYTDELIIRLQNHYPDHKFYFIIGTDLLEELPRWHNSQWLLENVDFVIVNRPGHAPQQDLLPPKNTIVEITPQYISSSKIRDRIAENLPIDNFVPEEIEVEVKKLYSKSSLQR